MPNHAAASRLHAILPTAALLLPLSACNHPATEPHANLIACHDAIRRAALQSLQSAHFYKPDEASLRESGITLPPLIVHEQRGPDDSQRDCPIVEIHADQSARLTCDPAHPVVYFDAPPPPGPDGLAVISFRWCHARSSLRGSGPPDCNYDIRGFEMLIDAQGRPIAWRWLPQPGEPILLFVSARLERQALELFGPPLPGRAFSIERPLAQTTDVVVARVLDDGPVPMGPFVYLGHDLHPVTLACRCMPSQVLSFASTREYELRPLTELDHALRIASADPRNPAQPRMPPALSNPSEPAEFQRLLRWPSPASPVALLLCMGGR